MTITREELEVEMASCEGERLPPVHPGEHIADWLEGADVTAYALAKAMHVPSNRLGAILAGKRAISADTAVRLAAATGASAEFWLRLQTDYDLDVARRAHVGEDVERIAA